VIDVEAKVYSPIAAALRTAYSGISVSGEYVNAPSSFPAVTIVEQDNYMTLDKLSTSDDEEFATVMYEVNVYSNKSGGKKSECRAIMDTIDKMMYFRNFTRIAMSPVPNLNDATIYRMTARYRAETDGTNFYRR
jgi:hypothetical protein